jgi:iron complex outermembrane receptor protein
MVGVMVGALLGVPLMLPNPVRAQQATLDDELASTFGERAFVSIATGNRQLANKAPASATVITAQDIAAMGATDITQVLESVPGLHVSVGSEGYYPRYFFRGIATEFGPEVLFLVNGQKANTNFVGNPSFVVGQTPVANISRIEVIRGPGSALYGADAFSGVINIITKGASEARGTEWGARLGSYSSRDVWTQYGGKWGEIDAAFFLQVGRTDGQRGLIEKDFQSALDAVFGTHASLAPGRLNTESKAIDTRIELAYQNWRWRAGYQKRVNGLGPGIAEALDPIGRLREQRFNSDLNYQKNNLIPGMDVTIAYSYLNLINAPGDPHYTLLPAGTFGGLFPDGLIGNPGHSERHHRFAVAGSYSGFSSHRLRFGTGYELEDLYKVEEYKNFNFVNGAPTPLGQVVNATGNAGLVYLLPHKRHLSYAFIQDEWDFAKDWSLTAGIRHDRYSDFGTTTNPRLALVWQAGYNVILKALYGRAFRAPSFTEQYNLNNPVNIGNPAIKPERIKTGELALVWRVSPVLQTTVTLFDYRESDLIAYVRPAGNNQGIATNTGDQTGKGLEWEVNWDILRNWRVSGNYSYQRSINQATGKDAGLAPHHHLFARSDWRFAPLWQLGSTFNYVADRKRQPGDPRTATVPDYSTVDLSLRREKLWGRWEFQAAVRNLFNRDAREPSLTPGNIPFDLPLANRSWYVQLSRQFQ